MELKFTKEHGGWVSEFEATADFNLHVEGVYEGNVSIYQRGTAGGGYAFVKDSRPAPSAGTVYDYDFTSLVYPKFIKVVCPEEPFYAEIVTDGEVTELKHQSKAVEITANGTTSITPDAGFAALNAVEVKVNVPQGGGGSASDEGDWEYYDVSAIEVSYEAPLYLGGFCKYQQASYNSDALSYKGIMSLATSFVSSGRDGAIKTLAVAFNRAVLNFMVYDYNVGKNQYEGQGTNIDITNEMFGGIITPILSCPRITKEEFYTL